MKFIEVPLSGAFIVELEPHTDERGAFTRIFCQKEFAEIGFNKQIVQINHSFTKNIKTIRGMHFQCPPSSEIKIIRCIRGKVFDVMVDIRAASPTFLKWYGIELSDDNMRMVYLPQGFAHGFQTLTDDAELMYHHSAFYSPQHERGIRFDDPALKILWPLLPGTISDRDRGYLFIDENFKGIEK
jgi:dTDP-4-dehydrorhamnose 3,5-epimerase